MLLTAELFGSKHIMGLGIMFLVIGLMFVIYHYVLKKNVNKTMIFLMIMFYVLEVIKISYMWIDKGEYPMHQLPFHLCSLPLYIMPLAVFVKNKKALQYIYPTLVGGLLFGGVMAMVYPSTIIGNGTSFFPLSENIKPLLSFIYHPTMIFTAIFIVYSGLYKITFKNFYNGYPIMLGFMFIAMIANKVLDKDFMLLNTGKGSPFQFLQETSHTLYVSTMIFLGLLGIFVFHTITYAFMNVSSNKDKKVYSK